MTRVLVVLNSSGSSMGRLEQWLPETWLDPVLVPGAELPETLDGFGGVVLLGGGFIVIAATGTTATAMVALLAAAIVAYDLHHKGNPFGPVVMGACRALVYGATAAALAGSVPTFVAVSAVAIAAYVASKFPPDPADSEAAAQLAASSRQ